jgi:hypothetical protein
MMIGMDESCRIRYITGFFVWIGGNEMIRKVRIWYFLLVPIFFIGQQSYIDHIDQNLLTQENNIMNSNHVVRPPFWIADIEKQRDFIRKQLTDPSDRRKYDEIQKKIDKEPWMQKFKWLKIASWTETINKLEQLYNDKKYYMSKKLREKVQDLLHYVKTQSEELRLSQTELSALVEWRSASSHEELSKWRSEQMKSIEESTIKQIEKADQTLDQLIEKCLEDIEESMDLSSLVDLD